MSYVFIKDENYRIGNLGKKSSETPNTPYPIFALSPPPLSISGSNLINLGIKDFNAYLKKNPHNFPIKKTIYIYKTNKANNQYEWVDEGNPFPKVDSQRRGQPNSITNLSDERSQVQIIPYHNSNNDVNPQLCDMYQNQIKNLQDELQQKNFRIEELAQKVISKDDIIATMKADLRIAEIENDKLEGALEGYVGKYGGQNGLSDGAGSNLMDKGLGILDKIASNPAGQEAIGRLMGKLAGFLGAPETVQPTVEQQEPNTIPFVAQTNGVPINRNGVRSSIESI